jgi:hypothetical protein
MAKGEIISYFASQFRAGLKGADIVRVYENLHKGIWPRNGYFHLVDSWCESGGRREVFEFKLVAVDFDESDQQAEAAPLDDGQRRRIIPSLVKPEVWKRDKIKCVMCGAMDELHFDRVAPFLENARHWPSRTYNCSELRAMCRRARALNNTETDELDLFK